MSNSIGTTRRALLTSVTIIALASTATGCAGSIEGRALPGMTAVDLEKLDYGEFPNAPHDYVYATSRTSAEVYRIESRRMLSYLVSPYDVDKDMSLLESTRLLEGGQSFDDEILPKAFEPVADRHHMFAGVSTRRSNGSLRAHKGMSIAILRFPSEASAQAAANDFDRVLGEIAPDRTSLTIPRHSDVKASTRDMKGYLFKHSGQYVIVSSVTWPKADPHVIAQTLAGLLDQQVPKVEALQPTRPNDILDLSTNPDGILRLTVKSAKTSATDLSAKNDAFEGAIFDAAGARHLNFDAARMEHVLTEAGVDLVAHIEGTLYRTRDLESAFHLQSALAELGDLDQEVPGPPGITDARCVSRDQYHPVFDTKTECIIVHGRYVAKLISWGMAGGRIDPQLYQRTAAQYAILSKAR
ncbi:DUF7373 family lipoprotein [Nocardia cyriacigeorgica]|uniref:DUF7373 family lipoprotein n=2 Tax=Nocardia cyriacigeorgica TaxID=135487 RepID=UPI001109DD8C|nr:hypothetical protein [Nocardia cyriacigeorgica]TLF55407.1 hypothetical protein FEK31_20450 [Nocardia cyriacigeorgica]